MALIQIDGVDMPEPSAFSTVYRDIDSENTNRNELGVLQRDRVRGGVRTLTLKWSALQGIEAKIVLQAVSLTKFVVSFPDPLTNGRTSATLYAGDRTSEAIKVADGLRWNVSFDNIEY